MTRKQNGPTLAEIVSALSLALGLIAAWLYAAGWSYVYAYFDRFRIPLLMLDIPSQHILVYGGLSVQKNIWASLGAGAFFIGVLWVIQNWAPLLGRFAVSILVVVLVISAFALARAAGNSAAWNDFRQQRASDYRAYPRVALTWAGSIEQSDKATNDVLTGDCSRLLVVSSERLFLIRPVSEAPDLDLDTFVIDRKKIESIRILSDYHSCH